MRSNSIKKLKADKSKSSIFVIVFVILTSLVHLKADGCVKKSWYQKIMTKYYCVGPDVSDFVDVQVCCMLRRPTMAEVKGKTDNKAADDAGEQKHAEDEGKQKNSSAKPKMQEKKSENKGASGNERRSGKDRRKIAYRTGVERRSSKDRRKDGRDDEEQL